MKLWILYLEELEGNKYDYQKFMLECAINSGCDAEIKYIKYFTIEIQNNKTILYYNGKVCNDLPDVVFVKGYPMELVYYLEENGCKVINGSQSMILSKNKFETYEQIKLLNNVCQPKIIFGVNNTYKQLKNILGNIFIAKYNFGVCIQDVELIENENDYQTFLTKYEKKNIIFQEYIENSEQIDVSVYMVGHKVVSVAQIIAPNEKFKNDMSQHHIAKIIDLTTEQELMCENISRKLCLEVCGLDFLFDKDKKLVFCKANASASFKLFNSNGLYIQKYVMQYIADTYKDYKNLNNIENQNISRFKDFAICDTKSQFIVSAPHAVAQIRNGAYKLKDTNSGLMAYQIFYNTNCNYIIKTSNNGNTKCDDDANYTLQNSYKNQLLKLIEKNQIKFIADIHTMNKDRFNGIVFGINGGKNIKYNKEFKEYICETFKLHYGILFDEYNFIAPPKTVSGFVASNTNCYALQIEINSRLLSEKIHFQKISQLISKLFDYFK